jgi:hypothetical protein
MIQTEFTQDGSDGSAWFRLRGCDESIVDLIIDPKILGIRLEEGVFVHTNEGIFNNTKVVFYRVSTSGYLSSQYNGQYTSSEYECQYNQKTYEVTWGVDPKCFILTVQRKGTNEKSISGKLVRKIMESLAEYVLDENQ